MTPDFSLTEEFAAKMTQAEAVKLIKSLCIPHAYTAVQTLVNICNNPRVNPNARVQAATVLLDRGFGKPEQNQTVALPPGTGKTGVMLVPSQQGIEAWAKQAQEHHSKMITSQK